MGGWAKRPWALNRLGSYVEIFFKVLLTHFTRTSCLKKTDSGTLPQTTWEQCVAVAAAHPAAARAQAKESRARQPMALAVRLPLLGGTDCGGSAQRSPGSAPRPRAWADARGGPMSLSTRNRPGTRAHTHSFHRQSKETRTRVSQCACAPPAWPPEWVPGAGVRLPSRGLTTCPPPCQVGGPRVPIPHAGSEL